jgi:hypothetical protein
MRAIEKELALPAGEKQFHSLGSVIFRLRRSTYGQLAALKMKRHRRRINRSFACSEKGAAVAASYGQNRWVI